MVTEHRYVTAHSLPVRVLGAILLLTEPPAAAEWWPSVRFGTVRMVSLGAQEGAADRQLLARLWRGGVASGHITLEELAALLLCWQPARLLGLPAKGRLPPGCDVELAVLDPEAPATGDEQGGAQPSAGEGAANGMEDSEAAARRRAVCRCRAAGRMPPPRRDAGSAPPRCASHFGGWQTNQTHCTAKWHRILAAVVAFRFRRRACPGGQGMVHGTAMIGPHGERRLGDSLGQRITRRASGAGRSRGTVRRYGQAGRRPEARHSPRSGSHFGAAPADSAAGS